MPRLAPELLGERGIGDRVEIVLRAQQRAAHEEQRDDQRRDPGEAAR